MKNDFIKAASLGLEIAVAVFLGAFIGYQIDLRFSSQPIGMALGVLIGAAAGLWNAVRVGLKEK
ncbi:MAG: AtpZ/AtpI family protein [Candidatus Margulisiibacteriota bacterium]